jgi:ribosomal protein S18 acetylase RimI-like enzyme
MTSVLQVTYMQLLKAPSAPACAAGSERMGMERLTRDAYLALYTKVGAPVRWDQRLSMSNAELGAMLAGDSCRIYVARDIQGNALGFCEFDRSEFPSIELKNFGMVSEAQGRGLGPRLLAVALHREWQSGPHLIWLHTDTWDHPAAVRVYQRAGFEIYAVRDEPAALR